MKSLQKAAVWAPLVGYTLSVAMLLLAINGVAWFYQEAEDGIAIIDLRTYLLAGLAAGVLILLLLSQLKNKEKNSIYGIAGSLLMFGGLLFSVFSMPLFLNESNVHLAGSFCIGLGLACTLRSCAPFLKGFNSRQVISLCVGVGIAALLLYFIIDSCPQTLGIVFTLLMPCFAAVLLSSLFVKDSSEDIYISSENPDEKLGTHGEINYESDRLVYQLGAVLLVLFVSLVLKQNYYLEAAGILSIYSSMATAFAFLIVFLAVLFVVLLRSPRPVLSLRVMHAVALGVLVVSGIVFNVDMTNDILVGLSFSLALLVVMGYACLFLVTLLNCSQKVVKTILLVLSLLMLVFAGIFIFGPYANFVRLFLVSPPGLLISMGVAAAVLIFFMASSNPQVLFEGSGFFGDSREEAGLAEDAPTVCPPDWSQACAALAESGQLTAREIEVLVLLAQGYKNDRISEELVVSSNTVRAHVRNIYSKLEIHSKADLMAKLLQVSSSL